MLSFLTLFHQKRHSNKKRVAVSNDHRTRLEENNTNSLLDQNFALFLVVRSVHFDGLSYGLAKYIQYSHHGRTGIHWFVQN